MISTEQIAADGTAFYEKNFLDVFAILVILLELTSSNDKSWRTLMRSAHPFCFEVAEAIAKMRNLELFIELKLVTTTIRYSIRDDLATTLIGKFSDARLIHDPTTRTRDNMKSVSRVQVTPKGAALVYDFCKNIGMCKEKMPAVVHSNINTMQLFRFDRSPTTGKILHSEYFNHILIAAVMGPEPNVWHPDQKPVAARNRFVEDTTVSGNYDPKSVPKTKQVSPLYHRYFGNPESEAHVQYYESGTGVRLFHDRKFGLGSESAMVEYCFSGKALVQWLCDCTTAYSKTEAKEIGQVLLDQNFIVPVTVAQSSDIFYNHPEAIYTLTELGLQSCKWTCSRPSAGLIVSGALPLLQEPDRDTKGDNRLLRRRKAVTLGYVFSDPGMCYLFRMHLQKENCIDNFDAYVQLQEFIGRKRICSRMLRDAVRAENKEERRNIKLAIEDFAAKNILMAFHVYSKYFSLDSVYNLNIDFDLQQELDCVIANVEQSSSSPTRAFNDDISMYFKRLNVHKSYYLPSSAMRSSERPIEDGEKIIEATQGDTSSSSLSPGDLSFGSSSSHSQEALENKVAYHYQFDNNIRAKSPLEESVEALVRIWCVFDKVAASLYQMMESDLFPKFFTSEEYLAAMDSIHRRL